MHEQPTGKDTNLVSQERARNSLQKIIQVIGGDQEFNALEMGNALLDVYCYLREPGPAQNAQEYLRKEWTECITEQAPMHGQVQAFQNDLDALEKISSEKKGQHVFYVDGIIRLAIGFPKDTPTIRLVGDHLPNHDLRFDQIK